jgi:glycosyltransferase involved in cell wall biosynthesis
METRDTHPRILFFLSSLTTGGAERQTVLLAKELRAAGYRSELLSYYEQISPNVVDDEARAHLTVVAGRSMRNVFEWPKTWSAIAKLAPDIIVSTNASLVPILIAGRALGRIDAKIICTYHSTLLTDWKTRLTFPMFWLSLRDADCLVCVCKAQSDHWAARGLRARDRAIIYNGVDETRYAEGAIPDDKNAAKARLGLAPEDYVIGIAATFRPVKNLTQAVDALAALRQTGIPAKLLLVGDGETKGEIQARAAALDMTAHILFAGSHQDVRPFIKAMDVGMLCSKSEAFSMAALEIMAMGVPMVMPRVGGCGEIVEGGRGGRLFEVGNTQELTARLRELFDADARQKAATEARAIVVERFTEKRMVDRYTSLFDRLIPAARARLGAAAAV